VSCRSSSQLSDELESPVSGGLVGGSPPSCREKRKVKGGAHFGSTDEVADLQGGEHQDMCLEKRGQLAAPATVHEASSFHAGHLGRAGCSCSEAICNHVKKGFYLRGLPRALGAHLFGDLTLAVQFVGYLSTKPGHNSAMR